MAKLDCLSRDLAFIGWLQNTDIKFVCCDMPEATRETIGIIGVMARWEREQISKRTKEALAEKKRQGVKLGYDRREVKAGVKRYWKAYKKRQKELQKQQAKIEAKTKKPIKPNKTFKQIAEALNEEGIPSRYGGKWHKTSVLRVANRNDIE